MAGRIRRLWVFDFDGTLSPIVPARDAARLHPAAEDLLRSLSGRPGDTVAILSSRELSDVMIRVPLPKIYLGGGSGLEWKVPGGGRIGMTAEAKQRAERAREMLAPLLRACSTIPGVEVEDKHWSVAVHFRNVPPQDLPALHDLRNRISSNKDINVFTGPCVLDIQVLQEGSKVLGLERLCQSLRYDPSRGGVFYAGDDENDARAMRWVLARKGTAVSVGGKIRVPGVRPVTGTGDLARMIRGMTGCTA